MRQSYVAILEQEARFHQSFTTEPWECAWAVEARWFLRVIELDGAFRATPELSPDGLHWCAEPDVGIDIAGPGLHSFAQTGFGPWLRLRCEFSAGPADTLLYVYLSLKG